MEDNRSAVILSAIDFSKAFNRLQHDNCLQTFARRGASTQIIRILAAFLNERTMSVRLGSSLSQPKLVNAGAPQGSVLGCYLFNVGVDDLENGFATESTQHEAYEETSNRTDDYPAASTPSRVRKDRSPTPVESPIFKAKTDIFQILPRVANVPHWIKKTQRL